MGYKMKLGGQIKLKNWVKKLSDIIGWTQMGGQIKWKSLKWTVQCTVHRVMCIERTVELCSSVCLFRVTQCS